MSMCKNGHDRAKVGITKNRGCRQCKRDANKASQQRRRTGEPRRSYARTGARVKPDTDGFEALYGPVPDLVPDHEWYDEEIVSRVLLGIPAGRRPFLLEQIEIVRRMTPMHDQATIAGWAGVSRTTVMEWMAQHG